MPFIKKFSKAQIKISLAVFVFFVFLAAGFAFMEFGKNFIFTPFEYSASIATAPASPQIIPVQHLPTPEPVRAIYMTSWVAGDEKWREGLVKLIEDTELNAIVIDIKDYTGRIAFEVSDPALKEIGSAEKRIPDIREFLKYLHGKNIYAIARISVFQDPYLAKKRPDLAVKKKNGKIWTDKKGLSWVEPSSLEVWDYTVRICKEAERLGFDELNFDYIRFPSDGDMKDIVYAFGEKPLNKAEALRDFFSYLSGQLKNTKIPLSADLFGMTTWNKDDLNVGQILEYAAPYFDYLCPMVYPSHYPPTFQGYANPAKHPYEIINSAMNRASQRLVAASSTPAKLRPWLQDFNLGAIYDAAMVRKEKQAVYDAGLTSWMLWNSANSYTRGALDAAPVP